MTNRIRRQPPKPRCAVRMRVELDDASYAAFKALAHENGLSVERQFHRSITQYLALR